MKLICPSNCTPWNILKTLGGGVQAGMCAPSSQQHHADSQMCATHVHWERMDKHKAYAYGRTYTALKGKRKFWPRRSINEPEDAMPSERSRHRKTATVGSHSEEAPEMGRLVHPGPWQGPEASVQWGKSISFIRCKDSGGRWSCQPHSSVTVLCTGKWMKW